MGEKRTFIGACPQDCPDTCSMLVTVEDGQVIAVAGNPEHPFTKGRLCVKVNNYQDRVNSKDRILYPLRRSGPKGAGEFERITWKEALEEIISRWTNIIDEYGPQSILPYSYLGTQGSLNGLNVGDPFFNYLGATISERTFCDSASITAYEMTIGEAAGVDPESFVHSRYIILWACNTLSTNSHHWPFIEQARKNGAKLVVIDPTQTRTARMADWHIRIRPGTDGALALAMINVITHENLVDSDYVSQYTLGFDELASRAAAYDPGTVSKITGIPAADIWQLAREYATTPPAAIRIGVALERHAGGGQAIRAVTCLPALIGSWRYPGGGLLQLSIAPFPIDWGTLMRPDLITSKPRVLNQWKLAACLDGELEGPPIKSLFVYNSNPVVVVPEQDRLVRGLKRENLFTIVSEQFLTDTARFADIVLPATTQVEQEDIMFSWGHYNLAYNNQSIKPMGEAVSNTELFRRLAKAMQFEDADFYRSDEQMIKDAIIWDSPVMKGITLDDLKAKGFARLNIGSPDEYAPYAKGNFPTPSGKCEFKSSLAEHGNFITPLYRQGYTENQMGDPVDPLPHYIPPRESHQTNPELAKQYPLNLISPKSHAFLNSCYGNMSNQLQHAGEQMIMLHPEDASLRNIEMGQQVRITSRLGMFEAVARLSDETMRGVVIAPVGYWRYTSKSSSTVQSVMSSDYADLGAGPTFSDTLVQVEAM